MAQSESESHTLSSKSCVLETNMGKANKKSEGKSVIISWCWCVLWKLQMATNGSFQKPRMTIYDFFSLINSFYVLFCYFSKA